MFYSIVLYSVVLHCIALTVLCCVVHRCIVGFFKDCIIKKIVLFHILISPWYNRHGWLGVKINYLSIFSYFDVDFSSSSSSSPWYNRHGWLGVKINYLSIFSYFDVDFSSSSSSPWYNRHGWLGVKNQLSNLLLLFFGGCVVDCFLVVLRWSDNGHKSKFLTYQILHTQDAGTLDPVSLG